MNFGQAYTEFMENQRRRQRGGRGRAELGHAEEAFLRRVWWPAFKNFEGLFAEYETSDYRDGTRYVDFAYIGDHFRLAIEIDGIESHGRGISQEAFADHLARQNDLVIAGWRVLRFSYKQVTQRAKGCQKTLQQAIGRFTFEYGGALESLSALDRTIVQLGLALGRPLKSRDVMARLGVGEATAGRHLRSLARTGWLVPADGGGVRVTSYRVAPRLRGL